MKLDLERYLRELENIVNIDSGQGNPEGITAVGNFFADRFAMMGWIMEKYDLPENLPITATGPSMGGHGALTYMVYAKRTPVACVANCPVCDMPFHYTERIDLPSSFYSAYRYEDGTMEEILPRFSPLHLAEAGKMPDAAYTVFHCTKDTLVNKELHSDRFVAAMEKAGHPVNYRIVPDKNHCDLPPEEHLALLEACAAEILG